MLYRDKVYFDTLMFDDIFPSAEVFEEKMDAIASEFGDTLSLTPYKEIYYILALKYVGAHTRYTTEFQFIMALLRELRIVYPIYKTQKAMIDDIMALEIEEIKKNAMTIRNKAENPNLPVTKPSQNLIEVSTEQESLLQLGNELEAIKSKYGAVSRNYQNQIYKAVDPLFRVIVSEEETILIPQGE